MSRRMVKPGVYIDEGPSGCRTEPSFAGSLVVGGRSTGPVMGMWRRTTSTEAELEEARKRFHPHGNGVR